MKFAKLFEIDNENQVLVTMTESGEAADDEVPFKIISKTNYKGTDVLSYDCFYEIETMISAFELYDFKKAVSFFDVAQICLALYAYTP